MDVPGDSAQKDLAGEQSAALATRRELSGPGAGRVVDGYRTKY
jgi:hypothetical protein